MRVYIYIYIYIYIESFKLLLLKLNNSNGKYKLFSNPKDAFLSKGTSSEKMASKFF